MYHGSRGVLACLARAHHSGDRVSVPRHRSGIPRSQLHSRLRRTHCRLPGSDWRARAVTMQLCNGHTPRLSQVTWACIVAAMGLG